MKRTHILGIYAIVPPRKIIKDVFNSQVSRLNNCNSHIIIILILGYNNILFIIEVRHKTLRSIVILQEITVITI